MGSISKGNKRASRDWQFRRNLTVDPAMSCGEVGRVLVDRENPAPAPVKPSRRRRWFRRLIIFCLILVAGLVWLNGPGLRLIAPYVVVRYLEKAGLRGDFKVAGSLTGGLSFSDLRIKGDKELASLSIDRVIPTYQWRGLFKGRLESLTIDGIHADLRLGLEKIDEEGKPPLDLKKLVETLHEIRGRIIPLELDLKNISIAATRAGKPALSLAPSRIFHQVGGNQLNLDLGIITDAAGREWPV